MSSPMPPQGPPPGGPPTGGSPADGARSVFNATDAAVMGQGMGDPSQITVAEAFQRALGIDVNSTSMAEFQQIVQQQIQGANPLVKAQKIAGDGGMPPPAGPGGAPPSGDMDALMSRIPS